MALLFTRKPRPRHQLVAKDATGNTHDALTSALDRESVLAIVRVNPWLVTHRLSLGWSLWWGDECLFAPSGAVAP